MKICPICSAIFDDSMNYCLEHGATLVHPDDENSIKSFPDEQTQQMRNPITIPNRGMTEPEIPTVIGNRAKPYSSGFGIVPKILVASFLSLLAIAAVVVAALYIKNSQNPPRIVSLPSPSPTSTATPKAEPELKIEVGEVSNGSFGEKFVKCLITNMNQSVITRPGVSLTFYENDVKVDYRSENSKIEYIRPNETFPIWIPITGVKKYNRILAEQAGFQQLAIEGTDVLYPELKITDAKMKVENLSSMYNFQRYAEKFYKVTGVVENTTSAEVSSKIYIVYYDTESQIVGYASDNVGKLKPGDKAQFDASSGHTELHGTPEKFEIITTGN